MVAGMSQRRNQKKKGQTLVEYALILAFVAILTISVLAALGRQITSQFSKINSSLNSAGASH
jgi:Flp pilus assembly pilin Flp